LKRSKSRSKKRTSKSNARSVAERSPKRGGAGSGFQSFIIRKSHYNSERYVILRDINSSFMSDIISKIIHGLFGSE